MLSKVLSKLPRDFEPAAGRENAERGTIAPANALQHSREIDSFKIKNRFQRSYFTVSVKLTGPRVEVDAEMVTVPAFAPVV